MFWQYFLERALALRIDEKLGGEGRHREQAVPPMTRASGVPTQLATMPNNRLPNDSMPRRAMIKILKTRPRFWSSTRLLHDGLFDVI